jgi:hypothetical protein
MKNKYKYIILFLVIGAFIEFGKSYTKNSGLINWSHQVMKFDFNSPKVDFQKTDNKLAKLIKNKRSGFTRGKSRFGNKSRSNKTLPITSLGEIPIKKKTTKKKLTAEETKKAKKAAAEKKKKAEAAKKAKNKKKGKKVHATKTKDTQGAEEQVGNEDNNNQNYTEEESGQVGNAVDDDKDEDSIDIKEWREKLLSGVNYDALLEFMSFYQRGMISAETFYTIIYEMLESGDTQIATMAINAASGLREFHSFMVLISVIEENTLSSELVSRAETSLNQFSNASHLSLLRSVISNESSSPLALSLASILVTKAATKASDDLKSAATQLGQSEGKESDTPEVKAIDSMDGFLSMLATLNNIIQTTTSGEVKNQMQQTVSVIERLDQQFNAARVPANG